MSNNPSESANRLELTVRHNTGGHGTLEFELTLLGGTWYHQPFGRVVLQRSPEAYFDEYLRILEQYAHSNRGYNARQVEDGFRVKGASLFESLIHKELRRELCRIGDEVRFLVVTSQESWIPWELLQMVDPDTKREGQFLCERFSMSRWKQGNTPAKSFDMKPMALVKGLIKADETIGEEIEWLKGTCTDWQPREIESSFSSFKDTLKAADHRSLHFAGHGMRAPAQDLLHTVVLDTGDTLTPEVLSGAAGRFGKNQAPFVFWNSCQSIRASQTLTNTISWPEAFLKIGAGAFIGTLWRVEDRAAFLFARVFYENFRAGETLGDAFLRARTTLKREGMTDWLGYVLYGDPEAKLGRADERKISIERAWQEAQRMSDFKTLQAPLLALLAVAREPLTQLQLAAVLRVSPPALSNCLEHWRPWLKPKNAGLTLDDRLLKWVREQDKSGEISLEDAHWRLVKTIAKELHGVNL